MFQFFLWIKGDDKIQRISKYTRKTNDVLRAVFPRLFPTTAFLSFCVVETQLKYNYWFFGRNNIFNCRKKKKNEYSRRVMRRGDDGVACLIKNSRGRTAGKGTSRGFKKFGFETRKFGTSVGANNSNQFIRISARIIRPEIV